jgi:starch-binding outer membrane protein, SusD/RagB family
MIKLKIIRNIAFTGLLLAFFSCNQDDFLETTNKEKLTDPTMWAGESNADIYLNYCYSLLPDKPGNPDCLDNFTDDNDVSEYYTSYNWKKGIVSAGSDYFGPWGSEVGPAMDANWAQTYKQIRACNTFIVNVKKNSSNFSEEYVAKRLDEARFLRAYFYSELFVLMGGMSIITEPQDRATMTEEQLYVPRSSFEETFKFIIGQLDTVINNGNLAVKYNHGEADAGRATLGAALALKGWIQLFAASPAYNSASPAVPPTEDNLQSFATPDAGRWADAAATNKHFIDTWGHKGSGEYNLYPKMTDFWFEQNEYNEEVIWDRQYVSTSMPNYYDVYGGGPTYVLNTYICWGNYSPTQQLVDEYQTADGKNITDPTSGYDPQNPYVNREKRFYDFVVFDGATYKMNWMPTEDIIRYRIDQVNPSLNEVDYGGGDVGNTGYSSKKMVNPNYTPSELNGQNFVYYRYAEILLNYAEAQNEAVGPDASVYEAVNAIRTRPGTDLPELPAGLSQSEMRDAIHHERRIELSYEAKRLLDLFRWKIAEVNMNEDLQRIVITNTSPSNNSGVWVYTPATLDRPHNFTQKMYFIPVPQGAIDQNPALKQNWGY